MKKVLVVEDDANIGRALWVRLTAAGYAAHLAADAHEGVAAARQHQPDLVLLDITMPGGGGFAVAEQLRQDQTTAHVPLIFLTASRQADLRQRAEQVGAVDFFLKPFDAVALMASIERALAAPG